MALIICPECSKSISDKANQCPHCGYPIKNYNNFELYAEFENHKNLEDMVNMKKIKNLIITFILLIMVVFCSYIGYFLIFKQNDNTQIEISTSQDENIELIKDIKDENELVYEGAIASYNNGAFHKAKEDFEFLPEKYKDSEEYLKNIAKMLEVQGFWQFVRLDEGKNKIIYQIYVDGWNMTDESYIGGYYTNSTKKLSLNNDKIQYDTNSFITLVGIYLNKVDENGKEFYSQLMNDDVSYDYLFKGHIKVELLPKIGMSEYEVRKTAWGNPSKINKTITANGTHEQWVYSLSRYVYLDNGVVTAIQE
jgi:rubrerythrin